jgi:hypothetical protein
MGLKKMSNWERETIIAGKKKRENKDDGRQIDERERINMKHM